MGNAFDLERSDGSTGDAGKQNAAQGIAQCHAVAAVERFYDESSADCTVLVYAYESGCVNYVCHYYVAPPLA